VPTKKRKTKKQTKADLATLLAAPLLDEMTFPFLELPTEIRNIIYRYALVDSEYSVRFEANISKRDGGPIVTRTYRARPGPPDRDDLPGQTRGSIYKPCNSYKPASTTAQSSLSVNILQACRQINMEASAMFYSNNMFSFEAVPHLYVFLMHFSERLPLITKLGVASQYVHHGNWRGAAHLSEIPLHFVFPLLASAVNLEALYLHTTIWQSMGGRPHIAARTFFSRAECWMKKLGTRKGNKLEVLNVFKLPEVSSQGSDYGKWHIQEIGQTEFKNELAGKLTA
jgi:hypothetical protein